MLVSAFITHKKAERFIDCQDRFSVNPDTKSIALSDGMSESIFQKYWAQILVEKYTSIGDWVPNLESVRELSPEWYKVVNDYLEGEKKSGRNPWRAASNISMGYSAGATILGVRFNGKKWLCDVLGDSCLVVVHDNSIKKILTSEDVTVFDNRPDYYDSNPQKEGKGHLYTEEGSFESGDTLLMVSDPFSDFLLKNKGGSNESHLISRLLSINTHEEFESVVEEWRNNGMHNDDSTLVIIKQDRTEELDIEYQDNIEELISSEICSSQESTEEFVPIASDCTEETRAEIKNDADMEADSDNNHDNPVKISLSQLKEEPLINHIHSAMDFTIKKYNSKDEILEHIDDVYESILQVINSSIQK